MSAEKSIDWLIDRLYEEDEDALDSMEGHETEGTFDEEELLSFRTLLEDIREVMPYEEPSASVRQSILAAAREEITSSAEEEARAVRKPQAPRGPTGSIWGRARWSTIAQIATVATVLIVGAFVLGQVQSTNQLEQGAPTMAADYKIGAPESAPKLAVKEAENDFQKKTFDTNFTVENAAKTPVALKTSEEKGEELNRFPEADLKKSKARPKRKAPTAPGDKEEPLSYEKIALGKDVAAYKPVTKTPPRLDPVAPKKDSNSVRSDLSNFPKESSDPTRPVAVRDNAPQNPSANAFGNNEGPTANAKTPPSTVGDAVQRASTKRSMAKNTSTSTTNSATLSAPKKTAESQKETKPKPTAATATVGGIERSSRAEQHDKTISQAQKYLDSGQGTSSQRARVMELLARAYTKKGQSAKADKVYDQLRREYPSHAKKKKIRKKKSKARKKALTPSLNDSVMEAY